MQKLAKLSLPFLTVAAVGTAAALWSSTPPAVANFAADNGYKVDPVHTSAVFGVKHNGVSNFYGRFNKTGGTFNVDPADPSKSFIDITIETDSVDTANANRDKHLKSGDFFAVTEFPTMSFKSKSFKKTGDGTYDVTGDLTIRGKTTEVIVPVTDTGHGKARNGEVAGFETRFRINRSDYGVSFMVGPGLSDEVSILFSAEGGKGT
ncbi:MAG: YceI family protein [Phycisphaeraceae bacterium]|nr:YceI family protein [Phycisphaeraceae bacterium]